jgi:DNA polymerase-1
VAEYKGLICRDGKIHPTFGLNTADTFRASAAGPNVNNMYKHDEELLRFRKCITAEPGQILLEVDYKAHEARVIGMASGDVELIRQTVEKIDIHKKWGGKIVGKTIDQVTAAEKYAGKNQFVFPSIYLAKPYAIAGYFNNVYPVEHFETLQAEFWKEFPGIRQWQKNTLKFYNENGYIEGLSGYRVRGPLTIYQIANFPIQGTAFHLLLDALNRIDQYLIDHHFKTTIINEIHDSILFSAEPSEIEDVIDITTRVMTSKRFDWQTVELDVDWEIGENWLEMSKL